MYVQNRLFGCLVLLILKVRSPAFPFSAKHKKRTAGSSIELFEQLCHLKNRLHHFIHAQLLDVVRGDLRLAPQQ
jgi:hypothetical protein